jgi:hypothetical protein
MVADHCTGDQEQYFVVGVNVLGSIKHLSTVNSLPSGLWSCLLNLRFSAMSIYHCRLHADCRIFADQARLE